jgi:lipopolysaccharide export LptBFGC system permease protein LptF
MSKCGVFLIAIALSVLPFIPQNAIAAEIQKQADSKSGAKLTDKIHMERSSATNPGRGGSDAFGDRNGIFRKFISDLSQEELERLKKLSKENPETYREEMRKRLEFKRSERDEQSNKLNELVEKFRNTKGEDNKAKIKNELTVLVKEEFDKKMAMNLKHLEQAEKKFAEFKAKLVERKKKADEIIDGRVEDLLKDPNTKW